MEQSFSTSTKNTALMDSGAKCFIFENKSLFSSRTRVTPRPIAATPSEVSANMVGKVNVKLGKDFRDLSVEAY